ncbi:MAG: hypothetical protein HOK41_10780 [Nitrospina sp.]|jgi:hypothetical protein|nr:hypothetical protein [Nitrospina sp.]
MENYISDFTKTGLKIILCVFFMSWIASCGSIDKGSSSPSTSALSYVQPLINNGVCGEGKGIYRKIKNSHGMKDVVVTIETDMSPDPNNWYPSKRDFNLKPDQLRILGCSIVVEGPGKDDSRISHTILDARFK